MVRASGFVLHFLFLYSAHEVSASLPIEALGAARDDLTVANSAREIAKSPGSLLCRRGLAECWKGIIGSRRSDSSPLLPTAQERHLIRSARYQEVLANVMKAQVAGWDQESRLPNIILGMASAKLSLTRQFGGFSDRIEDHLTTIELPRLSRDLSEEILREAEYMLMVPEPAQDFPLRVAFLDKVIASEIQDATFSGPLEGVLPVLRNLRQKHPTKEAMEQVEGLLQASTHSQLIRMSDPSKMYFRWKDYQIRAERDYASFLKNYRPPGMSEYERTNILHVVDTDRTFMNRRQTASILLKPQKITLEQFEMLIWLDRQRLELVRLLKAVHPETFDPPPVLTEGNARMVMLALVIESMSGPASQEALRVLQIFHDREGLTAIAKPYLDLAREFQSASYSQIAPPKDMDLLRALRPQPSEEAGSRPRNIRPDRQQLAVPARSRSPPQGDPVPPL